MKKTAILCMIAMLSIIFSLTQVYGAEDRSTVVAITLEDTREIVPDILHMNVEVNVSAQKEMEVINILGEVDKTLRSLNISYKDGRYHVEKRCWWEKEKRKCSGYNGSIRYVFELKEPSEQNIIFEAVERIKDRYGEQLSYAISDPSWIVSKKELKRLDDELKLSIIDTVKDFSERVGKRLDKVCSITSIDYEMKRPVIFEDYPYYKGITAMKKGIEAPEPKREEKTISVKASVRLRCE